MILLSRRHGKRCEEDREGWRAAVNRSNTDDSNRGCTLNVMPTGFISGNSVHPFDYDNDVLLQRILIAAMTADAVMR
jgi:hypothetical protein